MLNKIVYQGGGSKEGTKIILYKRKEKDNANQQWTLVPVGTAPNHGGQQKPMYGEQQQQQAGNVPYYPPPSNQPSQHYGGAGGMSGYGPPDDQNPQYRR